MSGEGYKPANLRLPKSMADRIRADSAQARRFTGGQVLYYLEIALGEWPYIITRDTQDRLAVSGEADEKDAVTEEDIRGMAVRFPQAIYTQIERMASREHRSFNDQTIYILELVFRYWDGIEERRLARDLAQHTRRIESGRGAEELDEDHIRMPASLALAFA